MSAEQQKTPTSENEDLRKEIMKVQQETRQFQGQLANRSQALLEKLKLENDGLKARIPRMELALNALIMDSLKPRMAEDEKLQYEALRQAAVEFFKRANVDPQIWKSLVS